jgi:hypothetical protein
MGMVWTGDFVMRYRDDAVLFNDLGLPANRQRDNAGDVGNFQLPTLPSLQPNRGCGGRSSCSSLPGWPVRWLALADTYPRR